MKNLKKAMMMGIIGLSLFSKGVKATTIEFKSSLVTVGEVDVPVYEYDITWGSLVFDYKYNSLEQKHEWREQIDCLPLEDNEFLRDNYTNLRIYSTPTCDHRVDPNTVSFETSISDRHYYAQSAEGAATITVTDKSIGGIIVPRVSWYSNENYDFVTGKLTYESPVCSAITSEEMLNSAIESSNSIYTDSECSVLETSENISFGTQEYYAVFGTEFKESEENVFYENARQTSPGVNGAWYTFKVALENDASNTSIIPSAGDEIGSVTVWFKTLLN